jgi:hypothetical protein
VVICCHVEQVSVSASAGAVMAQMMMIGAHHHAPFCLPDRATTLASASPIKNFPHAAMIGLRRSNMLDRW